jgi:hypothetical protein
MSLRLDGINPLAYLGVKPSQPPNLMVKAADPTANDFQNINVGTFWLVYPDQRLWILISVVGGTATWVQLYPNGGGGGGAEQFPCDSGTANEMGGVLNILGDGNIVTSGSGNTVTLSMAGDFVENFETDSGTAHPSSNTLRVLGGTNINTSGTSNAVTINLDNSVSLSGTFDVAGASGFGGAATFNDNVIISDQTNGVLSTNGSGLVTASNGTNGQLLIGGGTSPQWASLTSSGGTVIITPGPNSINLESTGGGGGSGAGTICFYAYQGSNYGVPTVPFGFSSYTFGTAVALTTTVNEGSAFYPGDGAGTPASFTAPVKGVYYIAFEGQFGNGTSGGGSVIQNGVIQIITPDLVYAGCTGQPSGQVANSAGFWYGPGNPSPRGVRVFVSTLVELDLGAVVTFASVLTSGNSAVGTQYTINGPVTFVNPGPSMPVTYVQGYLLKETM